MSPSPEFSCRLDHLVICAHELAAGVDWFAARSGLRLPAGGRHPLMGTHNHLSALGDTSFLEIIANDPDADAPAADRSRWFMLDNAEHQAQLAVAPKLTTWVVATDDLDAALDVTKAVGIDPGEPVTQTRGDLQWRIALRADGSLACDGVFPVLIQWPTGVNPVARMQDQQLRLASLQLSHPDADRVRAGMQALGIDGLATVGSGQSRLHATLTVGDSRFIV
ncbi:VOC family protein [Granulosicoccus sp. 3-233]|uniref:VOC family protein n=1 Tax=Granulosicoccus sp. 3-233 TaxID=3417969 RepID=UPI003D325A90